MQVKERNRIKTGMILSVLPSLSFDNRESAINGTSPTRLILESRGRAERTEKLRENTRNSQNYSLNSVNAAALPPQAELVQLKSDHYIGQAGRQLEIREQTRIDDS